MILQSAKDNAKYLIACTLSSQSPNKQFHFFWTKHKSIPPCPLYPLLSVITHSACAWPTSIKETLKANNYLDTLNTYEWEEKEEIALNGR